jgi:DNA-binding Lrp family transcriptional regulator
MAQLLPPVGEGKAYDRLHPQPYTIGCASGGCSLLLDTLDRQIVAHLLADGRSSFRAIGVDVGLSAPAVKRRVDRLVADGVIERFGAVVDPRALGWSIEAIIELFCTHATPPDRIRRALSRLPEVATAYTVTGDADAVVHLQVSDTPHLEQTLQRIRDEPFVDKTRSVVVLSRLIDRTRPPE